MVLLVAILSAVVVGLLFVVIRLSRVPAQQSSEETLDARLNLLKEEWSKRLSEEVSRIRQDAKSQVETTQHLVGGELQKATAAYAQVSERLGKLQGATEQVEKVGREVAALQDLLRSPKMRGGIGEFLLADLLAQVMPQDFYALQYEFSGGERVDAAIRIGGRLVSIDSKFPLERFKQIAVAITEQERAQWRRGFIRDVKLHIDAIAQKYIRPAEGTFDFALMYIPAENVYYETILREEGVSDEQGLFQHALKRKVIPVSPNSFYAYLQVILLGLRGFQVEKRAEQILAELARLQKELTGFREDFELTGKQLRLSVANYEKAERHLGRFEDRLTSIEAPSETKLLPTPDISITTGGIS